MELTTVTISTAELMERLSCIAAIVYEIGVEEEDDELIAFRDAIGIIGRARELPGETVAAILANVDSLVAAIRNEEPGKEEELITAEGKWAQPLDSGAGMEIIQALSDAAELVTQPDNKRRVDGLIDYLKDFFDLPSH